MLETQYVGEGFVTPNCHPQLLWVGFCHPLPKLSQLFCHQQNIVTNISVVILRTFHYNPAYSISYNYKSSQGTLDITCSLR